jgi:phosphoribosyl-ATP pyrophosphohydrolase
LINEGGAGKSIHFKNVFEQADVYGALDASLRDLEELKNESADLLYHLIVLILASNLNLSDVITILKNIIQNKPSALFLFLHQSWRSRSYFKRSYTRSG